MTHAQIAPSPARSEQPSIHFDESLFPEEAASLRLLAEQANTLVIGIDLASPADGIAEMVAARRAGRTIALLPVLRDPLEDLMGRIWESIAQTPDAEQRLTHVVALKNDQLAIQGGAKPAQAASLPEAQKFAAILALRLADVLLLGAAHESARWATLLSRPFRRTAILPAVPRASRAHGGDDAITIYAPSTPRAMLRNIDLAIAERKIPAVFVTAENPNDDVGTSVVIAPEWWRPLRVRSFAAAGHKVVAPEHGRVSEIEPNAFAFAPTDLQSLEAAIDAARTAAVSMAPERNWIAEIAVRLDEQHPRTTNGPLVSIVVRTYDRPALLERAIASIVAQTYENVEIVVVNNGGPDVRHIVERAAAKRPFQYLAMRERSHIGAASNVGARAARGDFVGYLDDDDLLYADHCARTVEALQRTNADVVYSICNAEYARMSGDRKTVLGFQIYLDREFNRDALYVTNVAPIHSIVHRRDLFDRFGYFDETLPVTDDWELWLRACSRGATFVHIDRVTCEYSWRHDPERGNMTIDYQQQFVDAYREIVARYAGDVAGRVNIHAAQQQTLAAQVSRAAQVAADPAQAGAIILAGMLSSAVPTAQVPE